MSDLEISLLGPIEVCLDGRPIAGLHAETAQALLAYLTMHAGTPCRRASLAGLLWTDYEHSSALTNLRQALRRLRTAIGDTVASPRFLLATRTTIAFNRESDYALDVDAFSGALEVVRSHAHRSVETCPACTKRLAEVIALYRGEFLAGFSLDSALFEQWMVVERERLHGQALEALDHLATYHEAQRDCEQAARYARRALALEPWREEAHRALMRALALSGQRSAALAQYETCRDTLREELSVEPSEETRVLYERVRDGEDLSGFGKSDRSVPSNLPAQLTPFVGRERELAEVAARLANPNCQLLTLVGPGGSGKTRLALEAAARELDNYPHGVFYVSLAPLSSVEAMVPTVAQAIGLSFQTGGDPKQQLLHYLRRKQMLLLLDNYEHLLEGAGLATDMLRMAPALRIVVTSRAELNVEGEHLLLVSGMECPEQTAAAPTEVTQYGALQLFASAAQRIDDGFRLCADNVPHVVQICRLVGGMPLAILLAAAWVKALTPAEIAAEIGHSYHFLSLGLRDAPERQRSMRAVFDHSWHLLAERERAAMRALSVFRGGWTREAAQEVAGASARDLVSLANSSMLQHGPSGRYEMHELLRQYAEEKLAATEDGGAGAHDRHCAYYAAALQGWERDLKGARQQAALAEMDLEIENARAAWVWAVERGYLEELDRAAECLGLYYWSRARYPEGEATFLAAVEPLKATYGPEAAGRREAVAGAEGLRVLARMIMWRGFFAWRSLRTEVAHRSLLEGLALLDRDELEGCDTRLERAFILLQLGYLGFDTGREDTRRRLEDSVALFRSLGNLWWAGQALRLLGILAMDCCDYRLARRRFEESVEIYRSVGDPKERMLTSFYSGAVDFWQGRLAKCERLAREMLAFFEDRNDQEHVALVLEGLGLAAQKAGRFAESDAQMERCLAICDELGVRRATLLQNAGRTKLHLGQYEQARALAQEELDLIQQRDQRREAGPYHFMLGITALSERRYAEAWQRLQESIAVYREFEMRRWLAQADAVMGYAARGVGKPDVARRHLRRALQSSREQDSWYFVVLALPAIALLLVDQGDTERALEVYALASRYPYVSNSRWFEDVAGREMAAAAEALPPEVVAAAQERGRARDLWEVAEELLVELGAAAPG